MAIERGDIDGLTQDFERLQRQKCKDHGGVEARVLQNLCFYYGEHYVSHRNGSLVQSKLDENKLHLVFNKVKKHFRQKVGRVLSLGMRFGATPSKPDPKSLAAAETVDDLILGLDRKAHQSMRDWETAWWTHMGGVAVEHTAWLPDASVEPMPVRDETAPMMLGENGEPLPAFMWEDIEARADVTQVERDALVEQGRAPESFTLKQELRQIGDVGSRVYGPLNIFVDASVRSLSDLPPGEFVYLAEIKTLDWIRATFGEEAVAELQPGKGNLNIVKTQLTNRGPTVSGTSLHELIPAIQGSQGADDPDMVMFVTGYSPATDAFPEGREVFFTPGQRIFMDRANPYEEIPLVDTHYDPAATSFWSPDFVTDLLAGNRFLNKRMSQLGEQANASIYDLMLLGPTLSREDIPSDYPGFVENGITEDGRPLVARVPGPSLPGWFMNSIELTIELLQEAGGGDLMSQKNFPGQIRGPLAVPLLQELLDSEDGPFFRHLGDQCARIKQQRINRVKQFYPPVRTLNFTGRNMRDEVLVFHAEEVLRGDVDFTVTVDRRSLIPELSALREARLRERLNGPLSILYIDPRTGQLDPGKIAEDLNGYDLERESKESQGRKFAREQIEKIWQAQAPTDPLPFYPHTVMMDEYEAAMMTSEWISASPNVRNAFIGQWNKHREFLQQQADQQRAQQQDQAVQNAVAQATQQTAAQTASATVEASMGQIEAGVTAGQGPPSTEETIRQALAEAEAAPPQGGVAPTPGEGPAR